MSRLEDFCRLCTGFERADFAINDARYQGKHFGSWYIEVSCKGIRTRQIAWDGRDGLMIVQVQQDGKWVDDWHTLEANEQSFERIVAKLV